MKRLLIAILMILSGSLLVSCAKPGIENTSGVKASPSTGKNTGTEYNPVTEANPNPRTPGKYNETNFFFIGNSLTSVSAVQWKFDALSKATGKFVMILDKTPGGYELRGHLADLKSGKYDALKNEADVVILQEYGSENHNTANSVKEIQKQFKAGTRFYFLLTEFDIPYMLTELKDVQNITYIPSGYAHDLLLEDGYTYDQLHVFKDYHPNPLYGYVAALTVYSVYFDTTCVGLPYDFLDADTIALIPGGTKEEKDQAIARIQEKVMEAVNAEQSDYE